MLLVRYVAVVCGLLVACSGPPRGPCQTQGSLRTVCGFENPEDLAVASDGTVVVSQMRRDGSGGSIAAWGPEMDTPRVLWPSASTPGIAAGPTAGDPGCPPPTVGSFAPHGITIDEDTLYVVNHGDRESVELLRLTTEPGGLGLRWLGCVELPEGTSANDVSVGPEGQIVVSNMSPPGQLLRASLLSLFGWQTGDVLTWRSGDGWTPLPESDASVPNGVAISRDGEWIYYAESGAARVVGLRVSDGERREFVVPGRPDNLNWSEDDKLVVASHESFFALARCLQGRPCRGGWTVFEIEPETGRLRTLAQHDGRDLGAVASAVPAGDGRLLLSAVFDDRIGVWSESGPTR